MAKRIERRASMRETVLRAAMETLTTEGFEALTIAGLAARIGVSVGGLYRYYPGKDAILLALQKEALAAGALGPGDAEVRTHVLWALFHGVDHFRKRDRLAPPRLHARRIAVEAMDALLAGWDAPRADLAAARRAVE